MQFSVEKSDIFYEYSIKKTAFVLGIPYRNCRIYEGCFEKVPKRLVVKAAMKKSALADSYFFEKLEV